MQLAKKHGDKMPVSGGLRAVAAAAKLSMAALHAELGALRASLGALSSTLRALPGDDAAGAAFKQARTLPVEDARTHRYACMHTLAQKFAVMHARPSCSQITCKRCSLIIDQLSMLTA
jgi:hypothetical protein